MSSPHLDPDAHGARFGQVTVTVDLDLGDCVITAPVKAPVGTMPCRKRFNSLDEVQGALGIQLQLAQRPSHKNSNARDLARALEFAGKQLKAQQEAKRK